MSAPDHWDRIEESASAIYPGRELDLSVVVNDLCRALLDLRDRVEEASGMAHFALNLATSLEED